MSDFDKEAEREKLRKQFAEDEAKRESTERMSELLLQGATMTNRHCDNCGDPIFRYDGREFCPTCQVEITDEGEEEIQTTAEQQQSQQSQQSQQQTQPSQSRPSESDATNIEIGTGNSEAADVEPESTTESEPTTEPASVSEPEPEPQSEPASRSPARSAPSHTTTDLSEARQSLVRTITRFAKQAEAADDLAYARECLAATEDAAEALEAVKRAER